MSNLAGQWRGRSDGDPAGDIIIDLDIVDGALQGAAYLYPDDSSIPASMTAIRAAAEDHVEFTSKPTHFNFRFGRELTQAEIEAAAQDGTDLPDMAKICFQRQGENTVTGTWQADIGTRGSTRGTFKLNLANPPKTSRIKEDSKVKSRSDFRECLLDKNHGDYIYRGQSRPWPLQTAFHRTGRKDLHRYLMEDIPALHRAATATLKQRFNRNDPDELGALMNLVQHHGYPTPLLDWSYSPFVAAWFAFSKAISDHTIDEPVRIFCFDKKRFSKLPQFCTLTFAPPHFSILEPLAISNDRAIPQQGLLTLTNVSDVEQQIRSLEDRNKETYLTAYDLPRESSKEALNDLALMGITRSTLFPGLDSICEDLRAKRFC